MKRNNLRECSERSDCNVPLHSMEQWTTTNNASLLLPDNDELLGGTQFVGAASGISTEPGQQRSAQQFQIRAGFVLLQLVVSSILVLINLSIMPVFVIYADLRRRILYRIMLSIALSDFLQLFAIWLFTLFEAFGFYDWPNAIEKFASGIYIVAWDHLITQHFLLALNRFLIIIRACCAPTAHKNSESNAEHWLFNSLILLSWLVFIGLVVLFMTPICGGLWDQDAVGFFYDVRLRCSDVYRDSEFYITIVFPAFSVCIYLAIVVILKRTRRVTVVTNATAGEQPQHKKALLSMHEKRILLLSVLLFVIITALILAWYIDYRYPPWTMLFCGYLLVNSVLSLTMNSEYRHRFLHMMRFFHKRLLRGRMCCYSPIEAMISNGGAVTGEAAGSRNNAGGQQQQQQNSKQSNALFIRRVHVGGGHQQQRGQTTTAISQQ